MIKKYIDINKEEEEKLELFYNLHLESRINLTAIKDREEFYIKHYLDSIYYFKKYEKPFGTLVDIGSGGGFPGVVISIFYPEINVTLVESIGKKCDFLNNAIEKLMLNNIKVINDRAENIKTVKYNIVTARGVSSIKELMKNTIHLTNVGSKWIMYKGEKLFDELNDAKKIINKEQMNVETIRIDEPFTRSYCIISR